MQSDKRYFLVTGASSGIGYSTVLKLAGISGCEVIAVSRNPNLPGILSAKGLKVHVIPVSAELKNPEFIAERIHALGIHKLDGIIHNAGSLINKPFSDITSNELHSVYYVNVMFPFLLTQSLIKLLEKAENPHTVFISSMGGVQGSSKFPGLSAYSSSKGALAVLCECLAAEFSNSKLKFNCLALGAVQTEMLSMAFPGYKAPMKPDEMAEFISWFVDHGQKFFNGKILPVALSNP